MHGMFAHIPPVEISASWNFTQEVAGTFEELGRLEAIFNSRVETLRCRIEVIETPELSIDLPTYQEDNIED